MSAVPVAGAKAVGGSAGSSELVASGAEEVGWPGCCSGMLVAWETIIAGAAGTAA